MEKQVNHSVTFPDAFVLGMNNLLLTLQVYQKSEFLGLLLNLKSFNRFLTILV